MPLAEPPQLLTTGRIAGELGVPVHRVVRIVRTRGHIKPTARAGATRLYSREALAEIRHELTTIEARRSAVTT